MAVSLPATGYRGAENQLYRVEIHDGGTIGRSTPTIKWARDNASVVFPIVSLRGRTAEVEHLGEDSGSPLTEGDWVEIAEPEDRKPGRPATAAASGVHRQGGDDRNAGGARWHRPPRL